MTGGGHNLPQVPDFTANNYQVICHLLKIFLFIIYA